MLILRLCLLEHRSLSYLAIGGLTYVELLRKPEHLVARFWVVTRMAVLTTSNSWVEASMMLDKWPRRDVVTVTKANIHYCVMPFD